MSKVFFIPLPADSGDAQRSAAAAAALTALLQSENRELPEELPCKLHFGERGNRTYLHPECYEGIVRLLQEHHCRSCFMETTVLYGGERFTGAKHRALAAQHGFTALPVVIADGEQGELSTLVPVPGGKHFRTAAIAEKLAAAPAVLVLAHFKGHLLAGFGGAIKQLSMGFASQGGKMAMHLDVKPRIRSWLCRRCGACRARCRAGAIQQINGKFVIDREKCLGCGACFSSCRHHAVSILNWSGLKNILFGRRLFREKLAEYALAAHTGKANIYLNFAVNITGGCDCEPRPMARALPDIGVLASTDPVAADSACWDLAAAAGKKFKGYEQLIYAEKLGLGSRSYQLIRLDNAAECPPLNC